MRYITGSMMSLDAILMVRVFPKKVLKRIIPALHAIKFVVVINEAVCIKVFGKLKEISKTFIE